MGKYSGAERGRKLAKGGGWGYSFFNNWRCRQVNRMPLPPALLLIVLIALPPCSAQALDLPALIRQVEEQYMAGSSHARMQMQMRVQTQHWQRSMEMEAWSLGRDRFLVRILDPATDRGVTTLKVDREVWNYLPRVDRVIKIPPSMMGGAWMGSHITNDDLVKANHVDSDYNFALLEETAELYRIEALPKPEAAVVWGKLIYQIARPANIPQRVKYYDEKMLLVREIVFDQVAKIDSRTLPLRMTVRPLDKPEEITVMLYRELEFDIPLQPSFFLLAT